MSGEDERNFSSDKMTALLQYNPASISHFRLLTTTQIL